MLKIWDAHVTKVWEEMIPPWSSNFRVLTAWQWQGPPNDQGQTYSHSFNHHFFTLPEDQSLQHNVISMTTNRKILVLWKTKERSLLCVHYSKHAENVELYYSLLQSLQKSQTVSEAPKNLKEENLSLCSVVTIILNEGGSLNIGIFQVLWQFHIPLHFRITWGPLNAVKWIIIRIMQLTDWSTYSVAVRLDNRDSKKVNLPNALRYNLLESNTWFVFLGTGTKNRMEKLRVLLGSGSVEDSPEVRRSLEWSGWSNDHYLPHIVSRHTNTFNIAHMSTVHGATCLVTVTTVVTQHSITYFLSSLISLEWRT